MKAGLEFYLQRKADPCDIQVTYRSGFVVDEGCSIDMGTAIEVMDPFNHEAYWPLRMVIPYLGRMGL